MVAENNMASNMDTHGSDGMMVDMYPRHVLVMPGEGPQVVISRAPFTQVAFDELHLKSKGEGEIGCSQKMKNFCYCSKKRLWRLLTGYIPIIKVIRYYNFKEYAVADLFAGLSVGTMHLPMALAFGLLASVKVENGLFSSLWPALFYIVFGTSAHNSMGTSAVICLLTATCVDKVSLPWGQAQPDIMDFVNTQNVSIDKVPRYLDFKEEVATGLTLIVGAILIGMGFLRLGFITAYLSDSFFAAFTSAAAVHIGITQLKPMLGITQNLKFPGIFKATGTVGADFDVLQTANFAAIIISLVSMAIIVVVKDYINEPYKHKLFAPIPIEFLVVVFATVASYFGNFNTKFKVDVVGEIPLGIPFPNVPTVGLAHASDYIGDAIVIAVLNFAYTISIVKICAKKHNYEIDDSQEMISYGICNLGSSFLRCIPSCVSPPRAMVASSMNARSTLCGVFSCIVMLIVIMVAVSLFRELPKAVLGAIIFISMKNLFIQIGDLVKYWRINKFDFLIWFCTFNSTVWLDIDIGLYVGAGVSALTVVFQTQFARGLRLGYTKTDTALVEHKKYKDSSEIPGVKVFRFQSNLYYANAEIFRSSLYRKTVNPRKLLKGLQKREKKMKEFNENRMKQGLPPQEDDNFIITGDAKRSDINISSYEITSLAKPTDVNDPLSILKPVTKNEISNHNGTRDLSSLDSEDEGVQDSADSSNEPSLKGNKRVQLPSLDRPLFTIESSNSITTLPDFPTVTKHRGFGSINMLKNSTSVVSLYSINFDDFIEDPDDGEEMFTDEKLRQMRKIHHVIVDFSPVNYIDASGTNVLTHIYAEYNHVNIKLYLAGCSTRVRSTMRRAGVFEKIPLSHFFLDVHDAVSYARPQRPLPIRPENIRNFTDEEAIESSRIVNA